MYYSPMVDSSVLIIGAGLVGSQIARLLVERGETPVLLDRAPQAGPLGEIVDLARVRLETGDVLDRARLAALFGAYRFRSVVHLAANPLLTIGAQRDPRGAIELNILGAVNVLEAAREHGVQRVVAASSSVLNHHVAGGDGSGDPAREEGLPRPMSIYASCKQAVENLGLNYARAFGFAFCAMRYGAIAGPWTGEGGGGPSQDFIAMVRGALAGQEVTVPGSSMEWAYSKDAAEASLIAATSAAAPSGVYNVTFGRMTAPEELAGALRAAIPGARVKIGAASRQDKLGLPAHSRASSLEHTRAALGFTPRYGVAEAARDAADWFRTRGG